MLGYLRKHYCSKIWSDLTLSETMEINGHCSIVDAAHVLKLCRWASKVCGNGPPNMPPALTVNYHPSMTIGSALRVLQPPQGNSIEPIPSPPITYRQPPLRQVPWLPTIEVIGRIGRFVHVYDLTPLAIPTRCDRSCNARWLLPWLPTESSPLHCSGKLSQGIELEGFWRSWPPGADRYQSLGFVRFYSDTEL